MWYVSHNMLYVTCYKFHVTCDMSDNKCDINSEPNIDLLPNITLMHLINRPGVARAVSQTPQF